MATEKESGLNIDSIVECPTCCGDGVIPTPDPRWHPAPPTLTEEPPIWTNHICAEHEIAFCKVCPVEDEEDEDEEENHRDWVDIPPAAPARADEPEKNATERPGAEPDGMGGDEAEKPGTCGQCGRMFQNLPGHKCGVDEHGRPRNHAAYGLTLGEEIQLLLKQIGMTEHRADRLPIHFGVNDSPTLEEWRERAEWCRDLLKRLVEAAARCDSPSSPERERTQDTPWQVDLHDKARPKHGKADVLDSEGMIVCVDVNGELAARIVAAVNAEDELLALRAQMAPARELLGIVAESYVEFAPNGDPNAETFRELRPIERNDYNRVLAFLDETGGE